MQNALWGIRYLEEVSDEGKKNGFSQQDSISMPANNFSIIYRKVSWINEIKISIKIWKSNLCTD